MNHFTCKCTIHSPHSYHFDSTKYAARKPAAIRLTTSASNFWIRCPAVGFSIRGLYQWEAFGVCMDKFFVLKSRRKMRGNDFQAVIPLCNFRPLNETAVLWLAFWHSSPGGCTQGVVSKKVIQDGWGGNDKWELWNYFAGLCNTALWPRQLKN